MCGCTELSSCFQTVNNDATSIKWRVETTATVKQRSGLLLWSQIGNALRFALYLLLYNETDLKDAEWLIKSNQNFCLSLDN